MLNNLNSEKYIHRNIWVDCCNNNIIPNSYTYSLHLKSIPDEINVEGAAAPAALPKQSGKTTWKKIKIK
tara:strand:- start:764 stop:970 length:207 start_codon:yes stop_codon:yes gene_type:complete